MALIFLQIQKYKFVTRHTSQGESEAYLS